MMAPYAAGRIGPKPLSRVAERVAVFIRYQGRPMAVAMSPTLDVTVDLPEEADEELVGVYKPDLGLLDLYKLVRGDLRVAADEATERMQA